MGASESQVARTVGLFDRSVKAAPAPLRAAPVSQQRPDRVLDRQQPSRSTLDSAPYDRSGPRVAIALAFNALAGARARVRAQPLHGA